MKKKTKIWIICGSIFGTIAVATGIAVPCALLLGNKEKVIDDFVFISEGRWGTGGQYDVFLQEYVYKDLNNWLKSENRTISLPFEYGGKQYNDDPTPLKNFRLFNGSERVINSSNDKTWVSFIDKSSIELVNDAKFSYFDKLDGTKFEGYRQDEFDIYKITTRSTWIDLEIKFPPYVSNSNGSLPSYVNSTQTTLKNACIKTYYYAIDKNVGANWWD